MRLRGRDEGGALGEENDQRKEGRREEGGKEKNGGKEEEGRREEEGGAQKAFSVNFQLPPKTGSKEKHDRTYVRGDLAEAFCLSKIVFFWSELVRVQILRFAPNWVKY